MVPSRAQMSTFAVLTCLKADGWRLGGMSREAHGSLFDIRTLDKVYALRDTRRGPSMPGGPMLACVRLGRRKRFSECSQDRFDEGLSLHSFRKCLAIEVSKTNRLRVSRVADYLSLSYMHIAQLN